jgi:signal transduction histidine kinase
LARRRQNNPPITRHSAGRYLQAATRLSPPVIMAIDRLPNLRLPFRRRRPRPVAPLPADPRNGKMLQAIVFIVGMAGMATALSQVFTDSMPAEETRMAAAVSAYAWCCFAMVRVGFYRLAASLTVVGSLLLIGASYYQYGLQAQPDLLMIHLFPMLFAGLLLGRGAVWWTALASGVALALGAWSDLHVATSIGLASEILPNLLLSGMNFLVLAVILDRLILSSQRAMARSRQLQAANTALKREIEEKEKAYARLSHTQRMEVIGRLSAGVAHDFNHILGVILGLAGSSAKTVDSQVVLPGIERAAQRGVTLTRRLLSFSRIQRSNFTRFDLGEAIEEARQLIQPMFRPGIRPRFSIAPAAMPVEADREELELALMNLTSNACDAMPGGGRFELSAGVDGNRAWIRVEDSGVGMPPHVYERMFDPFFTTKPKEEGTGIGMTIVQRFATDSGGTVAVQSEVGRGTRIEIRLPLAG